MPVLSSARTRSLNTANCDEIIQPIGPASFKPSCACGASCPKCRNPQGLTGGGGEVLTRDDSMATRALDLTTKNGAADGGVADGGGGGGAADGGAAPVAVPAAAPARSARLKSGPRYTPHGSLTPVVAGARKSASFCF
jgi:hypothetical protein